MSEYESFLASKSHIFTGVGIEVADDDLPPSLFDFQRRLVQWALRKGRAALWTTTGSGKTAMQISWAHHIARRSLILAPLAVAQQTVREGERLGIDVTYARSMEQSPQAGITITNYEMLRHFDAAQFEAVVLDESSCLANFSGIVKRELVETFRRTRYRLCCTATPAPNDTVELCNHADFLGIMSPADMLSRFFIKKGADAKSDHFRLKGHAHTAFFRWLASWAMAMNLPSDLGYDDGAFILPALNIMPRFVETDWRPEGHLFFTELKGIVSRAAARKATVHERVTAVVELVQREHGEQWLLWAGRNDEADLIAALIPGAVNVQGSDSIDHKVERIAAFAAGEIKVLVTKLEVAGMGLNFQSCARMAFIGLGDSWQRYYQGLRRCWRFGQNRPVDAYIVLSTAEEDIYNNVMRKEGEALALQRDLVAAVARYEQDELLALPTTDPYSPRIAMRLPDWLESARAEVTEEIAV